MKGLVFKGIITQVSLDQPLGYLGHYNLWGHGSSIMTQGTPAHSSFTELPLAQMVKLATDGIPPNDCQIALQPTYSGIVPWYVRYRETTAQFLRRLAHDYGQWFYYDGQVLNFGKGPDQPLSLLMGRDLQQLGMGVRTRPLQFSDYTYISNLDKLVSGGSPPSIGGLDNNGMVALGASHGVFPQAGNTNVAPRVWAPSELLFFNGNRKSAMGGDLAYVSGKSVVPGVSVGVTLSISAEKQTGKATFMSEPVGSYWVTQVSHNLDKSGHYMNTFEGIPASVLTMPVYGLEQPKAEPQMATVKRNKDPDGLGRVRVQFWWMSGDEMTPWIRVMMPHGGFYKNKNKTRGYFFIPEKGDQVMVDFRYRSDGPARSRQALCAGQHSPRQKHRLQLHQHRRCP